jgi:hypothetical protein
MAPVLNVHKHTSFHILVLTADWRDVLLLNFCYLTGSSQVAVGPQQHLVRFINIFSLYFKQVVELLLLYLGLIS